MPPRPGVMSSLGLLILRLGIGGFMATHGWGKLQMVLNRQFDKMGDPVGLGPEMSLYLVTAAEFGCAILVMIGLATRFACIPLVIAMSVAIFVVHQADPWLMEQGPRSKEPAALYLIPFLALFFTGPGRFSLDDMIRGRFIERRNPTPPPIR
jgi:putative oxidoreductase